LDLNTRGYFNQTVATTEPVPLPRGRHKLGRKKVRESQRSRLVQAMLDQVAERGYADTTIGDVVAAARVSRNAFYELFEDKQACFVEACDESARLMLRELYALAAQPTWLDAVREGMRVYLRWWYERPNFAVAYLVELPTAGRAALDQRDRAYERFVELFEALAARARAEQTALPRLSPLAPRVLVTAITEIVGQEIRAGRGDRLPDLEDELVHLVVRLLGDEETARLVSGHGAALRALR
jgi:AcrR family transcriptional regulator